MAARFDWAVPTVLGNNDGPTLATDAATKDYVDSQLANISGTSISNGNSTVAIATVDGNVVVTANSTQSWTFDDSGNLTLPTTGKIIVASGIVGSGASPAPTLSGFDSVSAVSLAATGNITGGNLVVTGAGNLKVPGGTTGDVLSTDGAGNISWLNIGAVTKLTAGAQSVAANASAAIGWTIEQNDIGLQFTSLGGTSNASMSYTGTGTVVLAFTWRVVWNAPTTQTGTRRAYIRENANNKDVIVSAPISGIPGMIQTTTTILTLSSDSGGVDIGVENYSSDTCTIGGTVSPGGDYFFAPSNECIIVLLGKY